MKKIALFVLVALALASSAWAYNDDFSTGVNSAWLTWDSNWSWDAGQYRGSSAGDSATIRSDWTASGLWTYQADMTLVSQPGVTADSNIGLWRVSDNSIGILAGVTRFEDGDRRAVLLNVQYLDNINWQWSTLLQAGWYEPVPDTIFHLKLERVDASDLMFTVTGNQGFSYTSGKLSLSASAIDGATIPGLRVYARTCTFDNVSLTTVPEPSSLLALFAGVSGLLMGYRRRSLR